MKNSNWLWWLFFSADDEFISCDPLQETKNDGFHDVMYKMDDELRGTSIPNSFKDGGKDTVGVASYVESGKLSERFFIDLEVQTS